MFWLLFDTWLASEEPARRAMVQKYLDVCVTDRALDRVCLALPAPARAPLRELVIALRAWKA